MPQGLIRVAPSSTLTVTQDLYNPNQRVYEPNPLFWLFLEVVFSACLLVVAIVSGLAAGFFGRRPSSPNATCEAASMSAAASLRRRPRRS